MPGRVRGGHADHTLESLQRLRVKQAGGKAAGIKHHSICVRPRAYARVRTKEAPSKKKKKKGHAQHNKNINQGKTSVNSNFEQIVFHAKELFRTRSHVPEDDVTQDSQRETDIPEIQQVARTHALPSSGRTSLCRVNGSRTLMACRRGEMYRRHHVRALHLTLL